MIIASILLFSAAAFGASFLIGRSKDMDKGKIAMYVTLVAWASLFYGFSLAKIAL